MPIYAHNSFTVTAIVLNCVMGKKPSSADFKMRLSVGCMINHLTRHLPATNRIVFHIRFFLNYFHSCVCLAPTFSHIHYPYAPFFPSSSSSVSNSSLRIIHIGEWQPKIRAFHEQLKHGVTALTCRTFFCWLSTVSPPLILFEKLRRHSYFSTRI